MAGTVSTQVHIKGRIIRIARSYANGAEFKAALREVGDEARLLREAAVAENKEAKSAYRKKKGRKVPKGPRGSLGTGT